MVTTHSGRGRISVRNYCARPHHFFLLFLLFLPLFGDELTVDPPRVWESRCMPAPVPPVPPPFLQEKNLVVDLIDPFYENGILTTEHGGVISAPGLRIQAQKITYIKRMDAEPPICTVQCEGNLLIDYQQWTLVGDSLYFDLVTYKGFLINGRTAYPPWYVGGKELFLLEDGTVEVYEGFITTSEGEVQDVVMRTPYISLTPDQILTAKHVNLQVNHIPIFWFPFLKLDLEQFERFPFSVRFGWRGFTGSYLSLLYRFLSWRDLKATARLDAFFGKGLGFGIESAYTPLSRPTRVFTRNYFARDIPLDDPVRKDRYRFQGTYFDRIYGITIDGIYDFVSDPQMAADYTTKDFNLPTACRTQIDLRHKTSHWIANLRARVRVNHFQTINQELPSFRVHFHPLKIPHTGILFENTFKVGYLDYVFSDDVANASDFSSGRLSIHPFFYRPYRYGALTITPEAGFIGIAYNQSPQGGGSVADALGEFGVKAESALSRCGERWKHVVEPYLHYSYLTHPTVSPERHFIFTIEDGWDKLNILRFGVRNGFFLKTSSLFLRPLWFDLWANAFFDTRTVPQAIPRAYLNIEWMPYERLFIGSESGWFFPRNQLDFYNVHADVTINENLAFGIEYRYRSRFDWRKADFYNFILDSVRSQSELLASPLSDERETFLFRVFARPTPSWTAKLDLRQGKHKDQRRPYLEYQIELSRILFQHWLLTLIYEKREADTRYSFSLRMLPRPHSLLY